jgi:hypothetical protein
MPTPRRKPPPRRLSRKPLKVKPKPTPPLPEKGNTRALKTGASADPRNLPGYSQTVLEVQQAIDAAMWIKSTDLLLLDVFTRELHAYRHASDALGRLGDVATLKKESANKIQIRRARVLGELAGRMGFTAESRFRLGLTEAKTERAKQGSAPVRTEERAREVAALLQRAGALPPPSIPDAEVVEETTPETEETTPAPEVITFPRGNGAV